MAQTKRIREIDYLDREILKVLLGDSCSIGVISRVLQKKKNTLGIGKNVNRGTIDNRLSKMSSGRCIPGYVTDEEAMVIRVSVDDKHARYQWELTEFGEQIVKSIRRGVRGRTLFFMLNPRPLDSVDWAILSAMSVLCIISRRPDGYHIDEYVTQVSRILDKHVPLLVIEHRLRFLSRDVHGKAAILTHDKKYGVYDLTDFGSEVYRSRRPRLIGRLNEIRADARRMYMIANKIMPPKRYQDDE